MCIENCERGWLSLLLVIGVICLQMLIVTWGKIERGWIFFSFFVWGSGTGNWQVLSEADWPHLAAQRILRQTLWSSEWLDMTSSGLFFFPVCAFILCREWYTTAFKSFLQWFIWTAGRGEKKAQEWQNDSSQGRNRQRPRLWNPMLINCRVFDFARHAGLYWFSLLPVCMCCVRQRDGKEKKTGPKEMQYCVSLKNL